MNYNKDNADKIRQMITKYCSDWDIPETTVIIQRRLAILLVKEKIERWLIENKVKNFKVTFTEYSNLEPLLKISLHYKDDVYEHYGVYFDRNEFAFPNQSHLKPNFRLWLPTDWTDFYDYNHKSTRVIYEKLQEIFTIEKLGLMVNYPFIMSDYDDGNWVLKDMINIT